MLLNTLLAPFRKPSPIMLARQELEDAQRSLLQAHSATEYAKNLATYHEQRVKRLTAFLKNAHTESNE
jgi:hypothetical protein